MLNYDSHRNPTILKQAGGALKRLESSQCLRWIEALRRSLVTYPSVLYKVFSHETAIRAPDCLFQLKGYLLLWTNRPIRNR